MLLFLLLIPFAIAQNDLYSMDSLELQLNVDGSFELVATKSNAKIQEASADILLYPKESPRQQIKVANLALDRARRLVEMGHDIIILLDSVTRLARALNLSVTNTGRSLSGGFGQRLG